MLNDKTFVMIIILWQIAMLRDAEANGEAMDLYNAHMYAYVR